MESIGRAIHAISDVGDLADDRHPTLDVDAAWRRIVDGLHSVGAFAP